MKAMLAIEDTPFDSIRGKKKISKRVGLRRVKEKKLKAGKKRNCKRREEEEFAFG